MTKLPGLTTTSTSEPAPAPPPPDPESPPVEAEKGPPIGAVESGDKAGATEAQATYLPAGI